MLCPLCGTRRARRACPALARDICPVCCGTKRLVQIQCPSDCTWLASAREHPAAVVVKQQQRDVAVLVQFMRDFNERQSQLLFLIATFLVQYQPPELQPLIDDDVAAAAAAMAATFETAARGVIYEHRPASLPGERLAAALKPALAEAGKGSGSSFDRDAAVVLRRIDEAIHETRTADVQNRRAFLDLLGRMIAATTRGGTTESAPAREEPRLIVP